MPIFTSGSIDVSGSSFFGSHCEDTMHVTGALRLSGALRVEHCAITPYHKFLSKGGTTPILTIDTQNDRVGVNTALPKCDIDLSGNVQITGSLQVSEDITLHDGGSLKEAGGTAAFTFDGSGHVTKIGQDSPSSGEFLKWDGSKAVWDEASGDAGSVALDDITNGDAASTLRTTTGNITVDADAGTILVDSNTRTVTVDGHLGVALHTQHTTDGAHNTGSILLSSSAGGVGLTWNDGKDLWMEGGRTIITANENAAEAIKLHADAGANQTIQIINDAGTTDGSEGAGAIDIEATAGGISLHGADTKDIAIEAGQVVLTANHDTADSIKLHATAGSSQTITVLNAAGSTDGSYGAGAINLSASAGGVGISWADNKDLWAEGGKFVVTANENGADAIKLHADAGASQTITVVNDAGTAETAIAITSTAGGVDINANAAKDVTIDGGQIKATAAHNVADAIKLHADAGANQTITVLNDEGNTDGSYGAGAINLSASAGGIGISWADNKDLWAEGGKFVVTANENGAEAIKLHADAGADQTIQIINDAGTTDGAEGAGAIDIEATAGGIGLHAADTKDIWVEGGQVVLTANHNVADAIKLHGTAGANQTISVLNAAGSTDGSYGAGAINLSASAGGIGISWKDDKDLWMEGGKAIITANENGAGAIKLHADAGTSQTIQLLNDAGTASTAIDIEATAGGFSVDGVQASNITVASAGAADDLTIAVTNATDSSLILNSAGTAADALQIATSAGGMDITVAGAAAGEDLDISCNQEIRVTSTSNAAEAIILEENGGTSGTIKIYANQGNTDGSAGAGSVLLASDDGGIGLSWNDGKDLWAEGGRAVVTANEDAADCIKLHADAGSSQTITVQNDAGTNAAAIKLAADAGGITLDAGLDIILDADGGQVFFKDSGTTGLEIDLAAPDGVAISGSVSNKDLSFSVNDNGTLTEVMRLDGRSSTVVIGASSSPGGWGLAPAAGDGLHVQDKAIILQSNSADANAAASIAFNKSRHATDGGNTIVQAADTLGEINFMGNDGTAYDVAASIVATVDGTPGASNDMPGKIEFKTCGDGSGTLVTHLDVNALGVTTHHYKGFGTNVTPSELGYGEIVYFGHGPGGDGNNVAVGRLYYLKNDGNWTLAQANAVANGGKELLGIAMGDGEPDVVGMLIRGFFHLHADRLTGTFDEGIPLYICETTAGCINVAAPGSAGEFVRLVGYATDSSEVIYFNPSNDWVEL